MEVKSDCSHFTPDFSGSQTRKPRYLTPDQLRAAGDIVRATFHANSFPFRKACAKGGGLTVDIKAIFPTICL